jgi:hypothetical protein
VLLISNPGRLDRPHPRCRCRPSTSSSNGRR